MKSNEKREHSQNTSFKHGIISFSRSWYKVSRTILSGSQIRSRSFSTMTTLCSFSSDGCFSTRSLIPVNAASPITKKITHYHSSNIRIHRMKLHEIFSSKKCTFSYLSIVMRCLLKELPQCQPLLVHREPGSLCSHALLRKNNRYHRQTKLSSQINLNS